MKENTALSERELEILQLVATGASNKEIARDLNISVNTVKVHLRNIFDKLNVQSRTEAAMLALREGILDSETYLPIEDAHVQVDETPVVRRRIFPAILWIFLIVLLGYVAYRMLNGEASESLQDFQNSIPNASNEQSWQRRQSLSIPHSGAASISYAGRIYVLAGSTKEGVTGYCERYDPLTDSWQAIPEKPTPVVDAHAAVIGGLIYVPGGVSRTNKVINSLEVFNPGTNQWSRRQSMPIPLAGYSLVAFEGQLYLFGGWDGESYSESAFRYDPDMDSWEMISPLPTPRAYAGATVAAGGIYIFGGENSSGILDNNELYLPQNEKAGESPWETRAPLPQPRSAMGLTTIAEIIHVVGGVGEREVLTPLKYFPQRDTWETFTEPIDANWSHLGLVSFEADIFAIGGERDGVPMRDNLSFRALYTVVIPLIEGD